MKKTFVCYYHIIKELLKVIFNQKKYYHNYITCGEKSIQIRKDLEKCGIKFRIEIAPEIYGLEIPAVIIANHMSTLETLLLQGIFPENVKCDYILKKELINYPIFGKVLSVLQPIAITRKNPRLDFEIILKEAKNLFEQNISLIVFPQGTRYNIISPEQFTTIGVKLAKHYNVPVIPVALVTDAMGQGKLIKDFGKFDVTKEVCFAIDKPFYVVNQKEAMNHIVSFITKKVKEWGRTDLLSNCE
ncbi:MAG TPA: lysophospholipid acyltransferase family protein [Ignavibacteriales bacterium]|nr:lysophospholipid acyltransferase family protein [Ignavibacteriales bacterium]HOL82066.1 lysophospholipid acyltransferase family protein [Ignavibacteriales bacterium]HOM66131.1 lysophospholipid acyltransferase family protein [Ignavibacteriales bacterium]HPD66465.1 lysophospholipid acyltransferase family protein [Ignavibacteriales bacterium]HPP34198.1 lysophospholipid acyltransferase family protein [Ignavibacteriales bacterium]